MNEFNEVKFLDFYIKKDIQKNKNRSFSGMFKTHRMRTPLIADYPILVHIAHVCGREGKVLNDSQIYTALQYSKDFQLTTLGKTYWHKDILKANKKSFVEIFGISEYKKKLAQKQKTRLRASKNK